MPRRSVKKTDEEVVELSQESVAESGVMGKIFSSTFYGPMTIVVMLAAAFWVGRLSAQVEQLKQSRTDSNTQLTQQTTPAQQPTPQQPRQLTMDEIKGLFDKDLIKFGDASRKLLVVEVFDPSCPYCGAASGMNKELSAQMGPQFKLVADGGTYVAPVQELRKLVDQGKASLVWIYTPGHGNGEVATRALYCANEKGKFTQVEDILMSSAGYNLINNTVRNDLTQASKIAQLVRGVIDPNWLTDCMKSGKYDARLKSDMALAANLEIQATPGFVLNTTRFSGAYSFTDMKSVVDAALQ